MLSLRGKVKAIDIMACNVIYPILVYSADQMPELVVTNLQLASRKWIGAEGVLRRRYVNGIESAFGGDD